MALPIVSWAAVMAAHAIEGDAATDVVADEMARLNSDGLDEAGEELSLCGDREIGAETEIGATAAQEIDSRYIESLRELGGDIPSRAASVGATSTVRTCRWTSRAGIPGPAKTTGTWVS